MTTIGGTPAQPVPPSVPTRSEQDDVAVDIARYRRLAVDVLTAEGVTGPAELALTFVGEDEIAELNRTWLDGDGPTDVLAFPIDDEDDVAPGPRMLGDVIVCPSVAERYATANGRAPVDEIALLVVHGVLHVLGHDHLEDDEAQVMRDREHHHLTTAWDGTWTWGDTERKPKP